MSSGLRAPAHELLGPTHPIPLPSLCPHPQVKRWNETIYCCESQLPLDTSFVTGQGPYTITYDAYDYKWNQAVQVRRRE